MHHLTRYQNLAQQNSKYLTYHVHQHHSLHIILFTKSSCDAVWIWMLPIVPVICDTSPSDRHRLPAHPAAGSSWNATAGPAPYPVLKARCEYWCLCTHGRGCVVPSTAMNTEIKPLHALNSPMPFLLQRCSESYRHISCRVSMLSTLHVGDVVCWRYTQINWFALYCVYF